MLHSNDNAPKTQFTPSTLNPAAPVKTVTSPIEQATIGRTLVIKGEVSGSESLYIDGKIEGTLTGNVECSDRVDIRSEGTLNGDVVSQRISVEDGAMLRGSVQLTPAEHKHEKSDTPKSFAAAAAKSN